MSLVPPRIFYATKRIEIENSDKPWTGTTLSISMQPYTRVLFNDLTDLPLSGNWYLIDVEDNGVFIVMNNGKREEYPYSFVSHKPEEYLLARSTLLRLFGEKNEE